MINLSNLQNPLVLILIGIRFKINNANTFTKVFTRKIAVMTPIAVAHYFETICHSVFEHLFVARSKNKGIDGPIDTCFDIVEINCRGILYLYYLV